MYYPLATSKKPVDSCYVRHFALLDGNLVHGSDAEAWHSARDMINAGDMPPNMKINSPSKNDRQFAQIKPKLRAFAGSRTDDGMDYMAFDKAQVVNGKEDQFDTNEFRGRLENLPISSESR